MGDIVSLPELKKALNDVGQGASADDVELTSVLSAAERMVVHRCGDVAQALVVEDHRHPGSLLTLRRWPVLSVQSVTLLPGGALVPAENLATGAPGYVLHDDGTLEHAFTGVRAVRVAYTCGRASIPLDLKHGTEQLAVHLWRASQNRVGVGGRSVMGGGGGQDMPVPAGFALPHRVAELLEGELRPEVIA